MFGKAAKANELWIMYVFIYCGINILIISFLFSVEN